MADSGCSGVGNNREAPLRDFFKPVLNNNYSSIARTPINANNFELKPSLITMVQQQQFGSSTVEDLMAHLNSFMKICDIVKMTGVTEDQLRLRLFPFSLMDKARSWLQTLLLGSITTWEEMGQKFLQKYFTPAKVHQLRGEISSFKQSEVKSLYEAWERFKDLLRRCPQHGYLPWLRIQMFYSGFTPPTRALVDSAAGGSLMGKSTTDVTQLIEDMAANAYGHGTERGTTKRVGIHEVDEISALHAQIATMTHRLNLVEEKNSSGQFQNQQTQHVQSIAEANKTSYSGEVSIEQLNAMNRFSGYQGQAGGYSVPKYYHPGVRNHENFSYANNRNAQLPPGFVRQQPLQDKKPSLEDKLDEMMNMHTRFFKKLTGRVDKNDTRVLGIEIQIGNMNATVKSLETQVGQLAQLVSNQQRSSFPSDTQVNPKESCKAVIIRSGKKVASPPHPSKPSIEADEVVSDDINVRKQPAVQHEEPSKSKGKAKENVSQEGKAFESPPLPFLQRFQKKKMDEQFAKFLEIFKKIHINIPFGEAL